MAKELSQEALLDFLFQAGGRVTNAALLSHFKSFLRDPDAPPEQHQQRRELFKGFVNSVATVHQDPDGTNYVVLRRRYRDLLGEEELQRPRQPPKAAAPAAGVATGSPRPQPTRGRRRDPEPEEEPAGAAAPAADAGCNGLPARGSREAAAEDRRGSPGRRAPGPAAGAAAAQTAARCAAAETRGRCCWECRQNGWGEPGGESLQGAPRAPARDRKELARAPPAQGDRGAPGQPREGVSAEGAPVPATPRSPPATAAVEAVGSPASPPAPRPRPATSLDPRELFSPSSPRPSTQQLLQQQRTLEWVANHSQVPEVPGQVPEVPGQVPEVPGQGPSRVWSVLPDDFLQLRPAASLWVSEPHSELSQAPLACPSLFPVVPEESSDSWPWNPPRAVFRSIRCQLSLQDLDDFVDQESHGSEESSSDPKESPGGSEDGLQAVLGTPEKGKLKNPPGDLSSKEGRCSPQDLRNRGDGPGPQQVPAPAKGLGGHVQEPLPWPAPKLGRSFGRNSPAGRAKSSSSDEEYLDGEMLKMTQGPRSRKPSGAKAVPSPRVDAALIQKSADVKAGGSELGQPHGPWVPSRDGPAALVPHRPSEHKSSLVPLDAREHEWIVKLASGAWLQVSTLFWEDPQLALHRDFLTGYTALHWMAKHGSLQALQDLVAGAQTAGIALDVNVRSSCGYTPLHLAAIHGHQGVIKLLVQRLASRVNVRDSSGKKPWQYLTSSTSGEIWQLLGAPRGKPIFPVYPLVRSSSPTRKVKSRETSRNITRKTSLAALLKNQHNKWKSSNQHEKFHILREREEYSD